MMMTRSPQAAKISFQNRTDNLKVEVLVVVHGDIAETHHGAHKGAMFLTFYRKRCRGLARW